MGKNKVEAREKRHGKFRKRISGTAERPRLVIRRSLRNIFVQVIDDTKAHTIYSFSTQDKNFQKTAAKTPKTKQAEKLGVMFGSQLKEKGIKKIAFDRAGYKYHGRVKALADSLRQAGIEF